MSGRTTGLKREPTRHPRAGGRMQELTIEKGLLLPPSLDLGLPQHMREELKRPLGPVMGEEELAQRLEDAGPIATVGDMCTETVHRLGFHIHLAVVDYQTKRVFDPMWEKATAMVGDVTVHVSSEAACISSSMYNTILTSWSSPGSVKVVVEGEEDLALLPVILHAPEGATVIYGIPDTGLALVQVDEGARGEVADVLRRFVPRTDRVTPQEGT